MALVRRVEGPAEQPDLGAAGRHVPAERGRQIGAGHLRKRFEREGWIRLAYGRLVLVSREGLASLLP